MGAREREACIDLLLDCGDMNQARGAGFESASSESASNDSGYVPRHTLCHTVCPTV